MPRWIGSVISSGLNKALLVVTTNGQSMASGAGSFSGSAMLGDVVQAWLWRLAVVVDECL
jgi:hypothetical protein